MSKYQNLIGVIAITLLGCAALLHVFWAMGGRIAQLPGMPEETGGVTFSKSPWADLAVAGVIIGAALLLAHQIFGAPSLPVSAWISAGMSGVLALAFIARAVGDFNLLGFFKRIHGSQFATVDSWLYSPACLFFGLAFAIGALCRR